MPPPLPPLDVELQLRRHGDALRGLAAQLVRGDADDAVQEVWIAALREPPRDGTSIGGWLRTVLLHVSHRWRRRAARRPAKESAAARGHVAEDHVAVLAREELAQRLLAAVRSLDPPYRDAIWQRFFEGKAPRDIAAASGVPLATVKSRLQRGLATLRARLGEREGADWRAGFVAAFGLRDVTATTSAISAVATGGVLMATWAKVTCAIAAAAVIALLCWPDGSLHPASVVRAGTDPTSPAAADLGAQQTEAVATIGTRDAQHDVVPPATAGPRLATIRGRCVDEHGNTLAACVAQVRGQHASEERASMWSLDHGELVWQDPPPQTTGVDGTFAFSVDATLPLHHLLSVAHDACVTMEGRLFEPAAGQVVDVGDVVMHTGVRIHGRVVDIAGTPCADVYVGWHGARERRREGAQLASASFAHAVTAADGTFVTSPPLLSGECALRVESRAWRLQSPNTITLAAGVPASVEVVVAPVPVVTTIRGTVVDARDRPIADAVVTIPESRGTARSARDGTFVLFARERDEGSATVRLAASAPGYEPMTLDHDVAWGSDGVTLRLAEAATLCVHMTDEAGAPIEMFAVRTVPIGGSRFDPSDARVRAFGPHANGTARIRGVERGAYELVIEFSTSSARPVIFHRFEATGMEQTIQLQSLRAQRTLRVVNGGGDPVAGTHVQLCQLPTGRFEERMSSPAARTMWFKNSGNHIVRVVQKCVADAEGRCELVGAATTEYGLRVLGPGHVPLEVAGVCLDVADELVVTVAAGGTLRGRVVPAEAVDELRRLTRVAAAALPREDVRPRLQLAQLPPSTIHIPGRGGADGDPIAEACIVTDDGTFEVAGLPAAQWRVGVEWWEIHHGGGNTRNLPVTQVNVTDGATTELELDLSALVPGTLRGTVLVNGSPLASAKVVLESDGAGAAQRAQWINLRTDAEGRFTHTGPPGTFGLLQWTDANDAELPVRLRAGNVVTLRRGETIAHVFHIVTGQCELRVTDHTGAPVPTLYVDIGERSSRLPLTDEQGRIRASLMAGTFALRVLPRSLHADLRKRLSIAGGAFRLDGAFDDRWLAVGEMTIIAGRTTQLELRLPPDFEK